MKQKTLTTGGVINNELTLLAPNNARSLFDVMEWVDVLLVIGRAGGRPKLTVFFSTTRPTSSGDGVTMTRNVSTSTGCPNHVNWPLNPNLVMVSYSVVLFRGFSEGRGGGILLREDLSIAISARIRVAFRDIARLLLADGNARIILLIDGPCAAR